MYEGSYSLINTEYVNIISGENSVILNKNLKYNSKKDYSTLFTKVTDLFTSLSTDTIDDIEIVTKKCKSQEISTIQLYDRQGNVIPDNKFYFSKSSPNISIEFHFDEWLSNLPRISYLKTTKAGIDTIDICLISVLISTISSTKKLYNVRVQKVAATLTTGDIYTLVFYVGFSANEYKLEIPIQITN